MAGDLPEAFRGRRAEALVRFGKFGVVGTCGFLVDAGVLHVVRPLAGLIAGRVLSFCCAVLATWLLNRSWTFSSRPSGRSVGTELGAYFALMLVGGAVNFGVYVAMIKLSTLAGRFPTLAVAGGSLAGLMVNFASAQRIVFRKRS